MESGEIEKRDIAWYRANFEDYPDLQQYHAIVIGETEQIVISTKHELSRLMHFKIDDEEDKHEAEEKEFAELVKYLTGDYYSKIGCAEL